MGPAGTDAVSAEDRAERAGRAWRGAAVRFTATHRLSSLLSPGTVGKSDGRMITLTFPGKLRLVLALLLLLLLSRVSRVRLCAIP